MHKIKSTSELRNAIVQLELKHKSQEIALKEQFYLTYESLKSINIVKKVLMEMATSPGVLSGIIKTIIEMTTQKRTQQNGQAAQGNAFKKIMNIVVRFGLTDLVVQHADEIKIFAKYMIRRIFTKREQKPQANEQSE